MRLLSNSRPIRTTRKYTARICGPYVRPVHTGVFLTPVYTARIYGPYLRVVRTGHPYVRPVCTARTYGCIFDTRIYGPYKTAILYGYILQVLRWDLELTMIASRRWYLYTKATNVCGIQDLLITKRVSSDVAFANIYSGIFRVTCTGRIYGPYIYGPYIRVNFLTPIHGP